MLFQLKWCNTRYWINGQSIQLTILQLIVKNLMAKTTQKDIEMPYY